jgi:hypothetical protein
VQEVVEIYNNTPHNNLVLASIEVPLTPAQVESNQDLEGLFIRENQQRLDVVKEMQKEAGLFNFKKGNILMVHLDYSKTPLSFMKVRRNFNHLAEFLEYESGNVKCRLRNNIEFSNAKNDWFDDRGTEINEKTKIVTIPIYYCKLVSFDLKSLPEKYKDYFF